MTSFVVSGIYASSTGDKPPFFLVNAVCDDCGDSKTIAWHNMQFDGDFGLFQEHHAMMQEFYEDVRS
jgi:hypothetical protein